MPKLHFLAGETVTSSIELTGELLSVGRNEENDICIEDSSISKVHGCFVRDGETYQIHDFASANGTHVNGERILAVKLTHGDRIHIGMVETLYDNAIVQAVPAGPKIKLSPGAKKLETPQILPVAPVPPPPAPISPSPVAPKPAGLTLGGKPFSLPSSSSSQPQISPERVKSEQPSQHESDSKTSASPSDKTTTRKTTTSSISKRKSKDDRVFIRIPEKLASPTPPSSASAPITVPPNIAPEPTSFISVPPTVPPPKTAIAPNLAVPAPITAPPKPVAPLVSVPPPPTPSSPRPAVNLAETMEVNIRVEPQIESVQEIPTEPYLSPIPVEVLPHSYHAPEPAAAEQSEESSTPLQTPPAEPSPSETAIKAAPTDSKGDLRLRPSAPSAEAGEKKIALKPSQAPREQLRFGPKKKD